MKKATLYLTICLVFFYSLFLSGCPESTQPQTPELTYNSIPMDMTGIWDLSFDWECTGDPVEAQWTIAADGTFTDNEGKYGTWELVENLIILTYSDGKYVYTGTVNSEGTVLTGTMKYLNRLEGCWNAIKAVRGF